MGVRKVQQGFVAGELSPEMWGRFDDQKYQQGLATCKNFIVLPQGPARLRPGTSYVCSTKYSDRPCRLIPFTFSTTQTMVLEVGDHYIRFHTEGKTLMNGSVPYEIATPYAQSDIFDIHYCQSMDVMTLVHPSYPPKELKRYGATNWALTDITFGTSLGEPTITSVSYHVVAGSGVTITEEEKTRYTYTYVVTAIKDTDDGKDESRQSVSASCRGNLYLNNATVTIQWTSVNGAQRYRIYKSYKGLYCYIGETEATTFVDDNYSPDEGITPPKYDETFVASGGLTSAAIISGGYGYVGNVVLDYVSQRGYLDLHGDDADGGKGWIMGPNFDHPVSLPIYPDCSWDAANNVCIYGGTRHASIVDLGGSSGSGANFALSLGPSPKYGYRYEGQEAVLGISLTAAGSGYSENTWVRIHWTSGRKNVYAGCVWFPIVAKRTPVSLEVYDAAGKGSGAELGWTLDAAGRFTSVYIKSPGANYVDPRVRVISPNGSGASFSLTAGKSGDYPGAVAYFEQRRCFAGTPVRPQMIWMTRSGTQSDMSYHLPSQDDDRLRFSVASQEASRVMHMVPLAQLIALTNSTEYRIGSGGSDPISNTALESRPQASIGASNVQPVVVNSTVVYAAARGGHLRELGYNYQAAGYTTGDLSIRSSHFFETSRIVDMTLAKSPDPIVWCSMSDGSVLGLTYLPEQGVGGWHRHETTNGFVESVTTVSEGDEDILYWTVRRVINGTVVRYIERMRERALTSLDNAWHVDCGGEYVGEPTTTISGLSWLEGQTVSILADGAVMPQEVVTDGKVELAFAARHVIVGLPIVADIQTLPVAMSLNDGSFGTGHAKNINDAWVRVYQSSGIWVGPSFDSLTEVKQRAFEPYGKPPKLVSEEVTVCLSPQWSDSGQLCIRQKDPLPLTVVSITWDLAS